MATPSAEQINVRLAVSHGSTLGSERSILDYTEPDTTTGNQGVVIPLELAAGATDQSVNLASYVDTCDAITIKERAGVGLKVGLAAGGTKWRVGASKAMAVCWNNTVTPPTLYFDNESGANKCFLEIGVCGGSS